MYRFNLSAPGMVFLYGDAMIMSAKTCIATSLDMRTRLSFASLPPRVVPIEYIELDFSSINLHVKIPLTQFLLHFFYHNIKRDVNSIQIYNGVKSFLDSSMDTYIGTYERSNIDHQSSLQAFFFLLVSVAYKESIEITSSFVVKVSTELTIGEGLGSSASFAVCLTACFLRWSLLQKGIVRYEFDEDDKLLIASYAIDCDCIIYQSTSVMAVNVSVKGSILIFNEGLPIKLFSKDMFRIKIILVYSNVSMKTVNLSDIERSVMTNPIAISILSIMEALAKASVQTFIEINENIFYLCRGGIMKPVNLNLPLKLYKKLSELIQMNQGLLQALNMSHPEIDIICAIAQDSSLAGKLTGKGKGGYAFILLPPNTTDEDITKLIDEFKSYNFPVTLTSLCSNGVIVE
ncbi:hypothetical protein P5V15_009662 [Pogonomyrmex californicus]